MTHRLYYTDPTLLTFDAEIVAQFANDPLQVVLNQTAFYPTSGGQPHDTGTLNGVTVVDVTDGGDTIVHHLAEPLSPGPVHGVVDAPRRHDWMQQHSAQHLLSALAADRFGWPTVSVHFGAESSTIEVATASVAAHQLEALERMANAVVAEARPITISFERGDAAVAKGLRAPPTREGELRVITIADLDRSACGGTHLAHTAEIGPIHLLGVERVRGVSRISFLAGARASAHHHAQVRLVNSLAGAMGCAVGELSDLVPRRVLELRELRSRTDELEGEVARLRVAELAQGCVPDPDGIRRIVVMNESVPSLRRLMAQCVAPLSNMLLVAMGGEPLSVVVATSNDCPLDANALLRTVMAKHGGKGGGTGRLAQGVVPADPAILLECFTFGTDHS